MKKRNRLTDEEREQIIAEWVECGNYSAVARKYGLTEGAVRKIVKSVPNSTNKYEQKKEQITENILAHMDAKKDKVNSLIDLYLEQMSNPEKLKRANVQQIATSMAIVIDKFTGAGRTEEKPSVVDGIARQLFGAELAKREAESVPADTGTEN